MSPANHRYERIGEEIQHELAAMVAGELKDPRLGVTVTVTEVRITPDRKHVRAFIGVNGTAAEQAAAIEALQHASGYIRHELIERLRLRRAPEMHFVLDYSEQYTQRIEQLLREMKKKDEPATS